MQNRSVMFPLLLVTGVFCLGLVWFNRTLQQTLARQQSPARQTEDAPAPFWKKSKATVAAVTNQPAVIYKTNQFRWNQIESTDYREYIANLRKIGCPEPTIRDIIFTDIMRLYAARRGQFYHNGRAFKFWETDEKRKLKAKQLEEREKQLASIDKEIPVILRELLGINYERELNKYFVDTDEDNRRMGFLTQDKRQAIVALRDEVEGMRDRLNLADGKPTTAEQRAELKKIETYRQDKLAHILSGSELDQFELSTSETADRLRKDLTGFNPTEEEFRDIYQRFKQIDDKFAFADLKDPKTEQEKADAEQRAEEEILTKLDPSRAQEYARAKSEDYRSLWVFSELYELPPSTAQSLFEIQQAVKDEKQHLLSAGLTQEQQAEALKAIQGEAQKEVTKILGSQLYTKFAQSSGSWLQSPTTN